MNCNNCDYYKGGYMWNGCALAGWECFNQQKNCTLVNDDGTVNYDDPFFAAEIPDNDQKGTPFDG